MLTHDQTVEAKYFGNRFAIKQQLVDNSLTKEQVATLCTRAVYNTYYERKSILAEMAVFASQAAAETWEGLKPAI